jgi:hypothetical protein
MKTKNNVQKQFLIDLAGRIYNYRLIIFQVPETFRFFFAGKEICLNTLQLQFIFKIF